MKTNNQKGLYNEKNSISTYVRWGIISKNSYSTRSWKYTQIKTTAKFQALGLDHEVKLKLDPMVYFAGFAVKF